MYRMISAVWLVAGYKLSLLDQLAQAHSRDELLSLACGNFPAPSSQSSIKTANQGLFIEWFAEQTDGSGILGKPIDRLLRKSRHEDYRHAQPLAHEAVLQFKSVHPWHMNICNQT